MRCLRVPGTERSKQLKDLSGMLERGLEREERERLALGEELDGAREEGMVMLAEDIDRATQAVPTRDTMPS